MKRLLMLLMVALVAIASPATAQDMPLPRHAQTDANALQKHLPEIAKQVIAGYQNTDENQYLSALFRAQSVTGDHASAVQSVQRLMKVRNDAKADSDLPLLPFLLAERAAMRSTRDGIERSVAFDAEFLNHFKSLNDKQAHQAAFWFDANLSRALADLQNELNKHVEKTSISMTDALSLLRAAHFHHVFQLILMRSHDLIAQDDARRYVIDQNALINTSDGAKIAAIVIRPRGAPERRPSLLVFTIYADPKQSYQQARAIAAQGYAGVIGFTRGKGHSPDTVVPFEHDGKDATSVIDWIAKQAWSDGRVGMFGGSYEGFTQWAAAKHLHPALKTIVPYVANNPGDGLPMENNVFLFVNYAWPFYVTNKKYLDNETYFDHDRWNALNEKWYASGQSYRQIDALEGTPNPWLQRWLDHPSFDAYWQAMVPHRREFGRIKIPVLTITGYYDDGQQSALRYLIEHTRYNKAAEHFLVIGPYDHFGAQAARKPETLREYAIDPVAQFDTHALTFEWMNHVFRDAPRPALLKDKINHQVMGANLWKHAPSIQDMATRDLKLYLSNQKQDDKYALTERRQKQSSSLSQTVDFTDRKTSLNNYYPDPIVGTTIDDTSGLVFVSDAFDEATELSGLFSGEIHLTTNKRDLDLGVVLYEQKKSGELFHLSYYLGRASHAQDMAKRKLLTPGKKFRFAFDKTRMVSRRMEAGSRLLLTVSVNKNAYAQLNHGSGKNVSDETIEDAGTPMKVDFHTDSFVSIPLTNSTHH